MRRRRHAYNLPATLPAEQFIRRRSEGFVAPRSSRDPAPFRLLQRTVLDSAIQRSP